MGLLFKAKIKLELMEIDDMFLGREISLELQDQKKRVKKRIITLQKKLKALVPYKSFDLTRVAHSEIKVGYLNKRKIERVIIILRSRGCEWALTDGGGCTMCGHFVGTLRGKEIPVETYIDQFLEQFKAFDYRYYPMLCVYNSGSFLNDREIDPKARRKILKMIAKEKNLEVVIFETRPEFITPEVINEIEEILSDKVVEIGVGLETKNDDIREYCLNKGFSLEEYLRKTKLIVDSKLHLLSYVLIKPTFLTEKEAIQDAIETAKFAFQHGTDVVSFEPVSVQDFTLVHYLYEGKVFRPPWLWSTIEVAKATMLDGFIRIGGFEFMPIPKIFTHNCAKCNVKVVSAIDQFNSTYDLYSFDNLDCKCKNQWKDELEQPDPLPLDKRINQILDQLDEKKILYRISKSTAWRDKKTGIPINIRSCGSHLLS